MGNRNLWRGQHCRRKKENVAGIVAARLIEGGIAAGNSRQRVKTEEFENHGVTPLTQVLFPRKVKERFTPQRWQWSNLRL